MSLGSDDTRERLLAAAGPIFAKKGFSTATVREICQAAEVNVAAVNYHFRDKERLYIEAVKQAHCARMGQTPLPKWPPGTPPERKLRGFIETLLRRLVADPRPKWQDQLMMRELFEPTEAVAELARDAIRPEFEVLQQILAELLPADTPEEKRHLTAFSIIGQCLHYKFARPVMDALVGRDEMQSFDAARLAEHIAEFSLGALAASRRRQGESTLQLCNKSRS